MLPPLPKVSSDLTPSSQSTAHSATPPQRLRAINGCMPRFPSAELGSPKRSRFPSAELGSPKPALRGDKQEGAMRRRSCPSDPQRASCPLLTPSGPQQVDSSSAAQRPAAPTAPVVSPAATTPTPSTPLQPLRLQCDSILEPAPEEPRPVNGTECHLQLSSSLGPGRRRQDVATPVSPALVRDDPLANLARAVAARMSGSPDAPMPITRPSAPSAGEGCEQPEGPKIVSATRQSGLHESLAAWRGGQQLPGERDVRPLPARFTPVELPATRLMQGFHGNSPGMAVSPWLQCRNVNEIHRNWSTPMSCSIERMDMQYLRSSLES